MKYLKKLFDFDPKEIKEITKNMTRKEKTQYIWQYFWVPICIVVVAVFAALFFLYRMFFTVGDNWYFMVYTNTREDVGNGSLIWQEYVDRTGYDLKKKNVEFNNNCFFDASIKGGTNNSYFQSFVAFVESKTLDTVVGSEASLTVVGSGGRLLDLDSEQCSSIREKYGDRFVYCEPFDEDYGKELVPIAIDISDSRLITEFHAYPEGESCVLGISAYTQHLDACEQYLDMILEGKER